MGVQIERGPLPGLLAEADGDGEFAAIGLEFVQEVGDVVDVIEIASALRINCP